ncbi:hypothetical protein MJO28_015559, partial [Puccinia striiformis f. sp. tritici]
IDRLIELEEDNDSGTSLTSLPPDHDPNGIDHHNHKIKHPHIPLSKMIHKKAELWNCACNHLILKVTNRSYPF